MKAKIYLLMGTALLITLVWGQVTTNYWCATTDAATWTATNSLGEYKNWSNGKCVNTNVACFRLADKIWVYTGWEADKINFSGLDFAPPEEDTEGTDYTWYLASSGSGIYWRPYVGTFPYAEIHVERGTLVMGGTSYWRDFWYQHGPVRQTGNGTIRISQFYPWGNIGHTFEIAEGNLIPMQQDVLRYTDVRVVDPAGKLVLTNYTLNASIDDIVTKRVAMGSFQTVEGGAKVDLVGNELELGNTGTDYLSDAITGTGKVIAVVKNLIVTNIQSSIIYGARDGRLRLDSTVGTAKPLAYYDFETDLTHDNSEQGYTLKAGGAVTRVFDETRGGYVAHFDGTASSGGNLTVTLTGNTGFSGNTDYTVSLWAKTAALPVANNFPTLFTIGKASDSQILQFRFQDKNCKKLLLGHWNGAADYTNISVDDDFDASQWHHYVVMRQGPYYSIYLDGKVVWGTRDSSKLPPPFEWQLQPNSLFSLGWLNSEGNPNVANRYFCGDIDDVRLYKRALGSAGVERLLAGKEPTMDGTEQSTGEVLAIPEDTQLALYRQGEIQMAGDVTLNVQRIRTEGGGEARLAMPHGGKLAFTGTGRYDGAVTGANSLVKEGTGTVELNGNLRHTGGTEVKEGTLVLAKRATQPVTFAIYDFEGEKIGLDASISGRDLNNVKEVTRVWDDERGGYVAHFPGTKTQSLSGYVGTDVLKGNSDYTVSVWVKPASDCGAQGTFFSQGVEANFQEIVLRYQEINSGKLVFSHWGTTLDFTNVQAVKNPQGAWHHYVAVRKGSSYYVYCDGNLVWQTTMETDLQLPRERNVYLGQQVDRTDRNFKGEMDDVYIYAQAIDAEDVKHLYNRQLPAGLARGDTPDSTILLPKPLLHYAFEDNNNPGWDSAEGGNHLVKTGNSYLKFIDSPIGGKALKFDVVGPDGGAQGNSNAYLSSTNFPSVIPQEGEPYTMMFWVCYSTADKQTWQWSSSHSPTFVSWGNPSESIIDFMVSGWYDWDTCFPGPRIYTWNKNTGSAVDKNFSYDLSGWYEADLEMRWHHITVTYDPKSGYRYYFDGENVNFISIGACTNRRVTDDKGVFYIGAKPTCLWAPFRGAIDEVKLYGEAFNMHQIRAAMRPSLNVLPENGEVKIDADANLVVAGTDEKLEKLSGEGTLDLQSGRVTLTGESTFAGEIKGSKGTLALASGAQLTLEKNPTAFTGYVDMAGGNLVLPDGVTSISATFKVSPIDTTKTTACAGAVEIPDGTSLTVSTEFKGPFIEAQGNVIVVGSGVVTLAEPKALGSWVIAQGTGVVDNGSGVLSDRWQVSNLPANHKARFVLANGTFKVVVLGEGSVLILR